MESKKVSIIIPVYNVEKYLSQCVNSVLNQTYKNLQIILVDDGSSDLSGKMCDKYALKDKRVTVIHKLNGGLSDARNRGVDCATGEFVYYLDSDDFIEYNAIELLMKSQYTTNADIVCSNFFYTYLNKENKAETIFLEETILSTDKAIESLVNDEIQTFAWGKLVRKNIAEKYSFPKGKLFEDHFWTHFIINEAQKIVIIPYELVHYRQRENSISFTFNINRLDILDGWMNRIYFLEQNYPVLIENYLEKCAKKYTEIAWLVLTRMKQNRRQAFEKLTSFNKIFKLENYSNGRIKKQICALNNGIINYMILALWYRLRKEG